MNHSIEELKRQYDAAYSRLVEARKAATEADKRLNEAQSAATGYIGKVAVGRRFSILVQSIEFFRDHPSRLFGPKIKKDGTTSTITGTIWLQDKPTFEDFKS